MTKNFNIGMGNRMSRAGDDAQLKIYFDEYSLNRAEKLDLF